MNISQRIAAVQAELKQSGQDFLIVPMADEFQTEFVPEDARRIEWLTGFTGSRALAVLSADEAWLLVPSLYMAQALRQLGDTDIHIVLQTQDLPFEQILKTSSSEMTSKKTVMVDARLITGSEAERWHEQLESLGLELIETQESLVDRVWHDRPRRSIEPARAYGLDLSGESSESKRARVAQIVEEHGCDLLLLTASDSIAWLLNIRGHDVPMATFVLSYCLLNQDGSAVWYVDERKVGEPLRQELGAAIQVAPIDLFFDDLAKIGDRSVLVDPATAAQAALTAAADGGASLLAGADPCQQLKAAKNATELQHMVDVHVRDGLALCRYLCWLEQRLESGPISELDAAEQLRQFRARDPFFDEPSFGTISAAGANAALPHYQPTEENHSDIFADQCYLVDSGGQYRDGGTTDVTRTIWLKNPPAEFIELNTRVLKGMIAVASVRFPCGTHGEAIDPLARQYLWAVGKDYGHGTGHGVGAYLNVHEGPQYITSRKTDAPLEIGNVLSNEPGYYRTETDLTTGPLTGSASGRRAGRGGFGIRIENLQFVRQVDQEFEENMLEFVPLTFAPIDTRIVDQSLLDDSERAWLNAYHAAVLERVGGLIESDEFELQQWMKQRCQPI